MTALSPLPMHITYWPVIGLTLLCKVSDIFANYFLNNFSQKRTVFNYFSYIRITALAVAKVGNYFVDMSQ